MLPSLLRLHEHAAVSGNQHGPLELNNVGEDVLEIILDHLHEPADLRATHDRLIRSHPNLAAECLRRAQALELAAAAAGLQHEAASGTLWNVRTIRADGETMLGGVLNLITAGSLENCNKLTLGGQFRGGLLGAFRLAIQTGKLPLLRELDISGDKAVDDAGMCALAMAFKSGYMNNLRVLKLFLHVDGRVVEEEYDGVRALSEAFRSSKMPKLETLRLDGYLHFKNPGLMEAIAGGSLTGLMTLGMNLQLQDSDMLAFCAGLSRESLASLTQLTLSDNFIGNEGMVAFFSATTLRSLPCLRNLMLDKNQIGAEGMAAFADAVKSGLLSKLKFASVLDQSFFTTGLEGAWKSAREALRKACTAKNINLSIEQSY